eukprot:scaffold108182_cov17-Tisochrysis_lutea.AAC.1
MHACVAEYAMQAAPAVQWLLAPLRQSAAHHTPEASSSNTRAGVQVLPRIILLHCGLTSQLAVQNTLSLEQKSTVLLFIYFCAPG